MIETIQHLTRLVDAASGTLDSRASLQWREKIQRVIGQFDFELRTELVRLGAQMDFSTTEPDFDFETGLRTALERYEQVLNSVLTAHTRAMLTRQIGEIRRVREEFAGLRRAA
ncbi:MAG TPA: hypothetical protein VKY31_08525 [Terriglobia bacterium]|nr:hypothetical protein [Terriglobia bacterium]